MTIKQTLSFSIFVLGFIASNNSLTLDSYPNRPKIFTLNSQNLLEKPFGTYIAEKTGPNDHSLEFVANHLAEERIRANDDKPCLYCPEIQTIVLNTDNIIDCKNAQILGLVSILEQREKEIAELKERLAFKENTLNKK